MRKLKVLKVLGFGILISTLAFVNIYLGLAGMFFVFLSLDILPSRYEIEVIEPQAAKPCGETVAVPNENGGRDWVSTICENLVMRDLMT